jgi:hypothetical protein
VPRFLRRRLWVLLLSAAVGAGAWIALPGTVVDRFTVDAMARGFANPPFHFSGAGTHQSPWALRTLSPFALPGGEDAPVVVAIGDDPENVFQSSPPAPIDLAVILTNIRRLGPAKAASAAVFSWEAPDPISLAALESALESFDAVATATPLSRAAVPSPIPPQFRRASIPLEAVVGSAAGLPVVNRLPIPGVILGGDTALAGFTTLDSEEPGGRVPLVARWDDRVVFAFPLLAVLLRHDLPVSGVELRPGQYLKLSAEGPVIPIDRFGRLSIPLRPVPALKVVSAETLIDGGDEVFPADAPAPVILRDDQSAADAATRDFSANLAAMISAVAGEAGLGPPRIFRRPPPAWEAGILATVVLLLAAFRCFSPFQRNIIYGALAGTIVVTQWVAMASAASWLPGLPALAATAAAFLACALTDPSAPTPTRPHSPPAPAPIPDPTPEPPVAPRAPITQPTQAAKKTAAKRAKAKQAPAKKAAGRKNHS